MVNEIKLFEGPYIFNIGIPIIVITGYSTATSELNSEYFNIIQGNNDYFENRRFTFNYQDIPPHPIEIDINQMMDISLRAAKTSIMSFVEKIYSKKRIEQNFPIFETKELSEKVLYQLYLLNEQTIQLDSIKSNTDSPNLKVLMQKIYSLPKFK